MTDLFFSNLREREVQYNARNSVPDFDSCMKEYARLAQKSKNTVTGLYNLHYGLAKRETLDIFPAMKQLSPIFIYIHGGYWRAQSKDDACSMAENFVAHGIAVSTIEYSLCPHASLFEIVREVRTSIAWIYQNAKTYGIDPEQIYVGGSSAGGHLASTLATKYDEKVYNISDKTSAKPNFTILVYPVISMDETITHKGSKNNLLGKNPNNDIVTKFSSDKNVTMETAPTFLVHASDDKSVVVENSINYFLALKRNKIASELHIYEKGGHGFGLGKNDTSQFWTKDCQNWLVANNFCQ